MYTTEYTRQNIDKIRRYSGKYSKSTGVYIRCLSDAREDLFDYDCSTEDKAILDKYVTQDLIKELYNRV